MTQATFELEAGTMEHFMDLLRFREDERVPSEDDTLPRRAVLVAPITHSRADQYGAPVVTRRVRASFVYGSDLVTLTRLTYDGYELGPPADDRQNNNARQDEVLKATKDQIEEGLKGLGFSLPVAVAWLKPAATPRSE